MKISKSSAQQIVEEIGKLVKQNINLMDETGHIIASNDHARIGHFHIGAYRIIEHRLKEYYITPELQEELPDVRQGLNLPIELNGEVQGVIGITGEYDEVIQYGQIVKKMAEILIRERMNLDNQQLDQRVRSRFLEDWILGTGLSNPQSLSERGFAQGIDIRLPRRCVVTSAQNRENYTDTLEGQLILERIDALVSAQISTQGGLFLRNTARQILLLRKQSTGDLQELCRSIDRAAWEQLGVHMIFGIDGQAKDVHSAYLQANRAWHTSTYRDSRITCYEVLNTELLLDDLSRESKLTYLRKIFGKCSREEIQNHVALLEAYFASEGSIQLAAQRLFIHKNTLQYRLKRLAEDTGLDARKPSEAPSLYLAMVLYLDLSRGAGEIEL